MVSVEARSRAPAPSFTPPKYRTTLASTASSAWCCSTCSIGRPAVPPGSPSSTAADWPPARSAQQTCVAPGCWRHSAATAAWALARSAMGCTQPMQRLFLMMSSLCAGAARVWHAARAWRAVGASGAGRIGQAVYGGAWARPRTPDGAADCSTVARPQAAPPRRPIGARSIGRRPGLNMTDPVDVSFFARAAKPLTSYRPYWAKRFGTAAFLPMSRAEMEQLGWDCCDVILVTGDAYVDHPSFGMAVIGRTLEAQAFRVGIIAQPD